MDRPGEPAPCFSAVPAPGRSIEPSDERGMMPPGTSQPSTGDVPGATRAAIRDPATEQTRGGATMAANGRQNGREQGTETPPGASQRRRGGGGGRRGERGRLLRRAVRSRSRRPGSRSSTGGASPAATPRTTWSTSGRAASFGSRTTWIASSVRVELMRLDPGLDRDGDPRRADGVRPPDRAPRRLRQARRAPAGSRRRAHGIPRTCRNTFFAFAVPFIWIFPPERQAARGSSHPLHHSPHSRPRAWTRPRRTSIGGTSTAAFTRPTSRAATRSPSPTSTATCRKGPASTSSGCRTAGSTTPVGTVLEGITRLTVHELCDELGVGFEYGTVSAESLREADEAFLSSTAGGVIPVTRIDDRSPLQRCAGAGHGTDPRSLLAQARRRLARHPGRLLTAWTEFRAPGCSSGIL